MRFWLDRYASGKVLKARPMRQKRIAKTMNPTFHCVKRPVKMPMPMYTKTNVSAMAANASKISSAVTLDVGERLYEL